MSEQVVLSADDLGFLLKAVQAFAGKPSNDALFGALMGASFSRTKEEASQCFKNAEKEVGSDSSANHKERCTLLEAKLIQMRDSAAAEQFCKENQESTP